jgi:transposase-like protein
MPAFAGRTLPIANHCALRALVSQIQTELSGLGPNDGGARNRGDAYDDLRWVQRFVPEFEKRWRQYSRPVGRSWRCDETYIKVKGRWSYLYRAVDKLGRTVDFLLSERRDVAAAKRFFNKAMKKYGTPRVITLDAYAASHRAITELKSGGTIAHRVRIRSSKYLNNVVEQDHRRIKQRIRPMLGFKRFDTATITISGIELAEKIRKQQFKIGNLPGRPVSAPDIWAAVLAA